MRLPVVIMCPTNNDFLMLAQRLRRWPNIKTSLLQRVVFAGIQRKTKASAKGNAKMLKTVKRSFRMGNPSK